MPESSSTSKRQKIQQQEVESKPKSSNSTSSHPSLFSPFRALGYISNHVPFLLQIHRGGKDAQSIDVNIVTCLGNSWAMWDAKKLNLLFLGPTLPDPITSMALSTSPDSILCAAGTKIHRYVRGKEVSTYDQSNPIPPEDEGEAFDSESSSSSSSSDSGSSSSNSNHLSLGQILVLGDSLISISQDGSKLFIWSIISNQLLKIHPFSKDFRASCILHPSTYLNKILIGSKDGQLKLLNIKTYQTIFDFNSSEMISNGLKEVGLTSNTTSTSTKVHELLSNNSTNKITNLIQSPVIDVVAIGYQNGLVLLHDLKRDESLFSVKIEGGLSDSNSSISFRTDNRLHTMAISNNVGDISIFDLDSELPNLDQEVDSEDEEATIVNSRKNRGVKLVQILRSCHSIPGSDVSTSISFLPSHPLLISTSNDNSLKQWFFEGQTSSSIPRLLKSRSGHKSQPEMISFYGEFGKEILSGSKDGEFRCLSINRESRSFELSQGNLEKKSKQLSISKDQFYLPKITSLSFSNTRSRDWDDILTTHENSSNSRSWFLLNKKLGKNLLGAVNENGSIKNNRKLIGNQIVATTSCVSACGNFGLVGNEIGTVEVYNLQSGIWRKFFDTREKVEIKSKKSNGKMKTISQNGKRITGIVMDETNTEVVISTSEGKLYFFDFHTTALLHTMTLPSSITSMILHRPTSLLCLISTDLTLRLIDISTRKLVRHFKTFRGKILSVAFSPDGRWIIASSLDSLIRTFDIPSSRLINAFKTSTIANSISFSPSGDFLASSHLDEKGIFLWSNKTLFNEVALRGWNEEDLDRLLNDEEEVGLLPTTNGDLNSDEMLDDDAEEDEDDLVSSSNPDFITPKQLHSDSKGYLITLTSLPKSRWNTLLNLDLIKLRNKPKEKPKVPEKAPFFLPQVEGTSGAFDVSNSNGRTPLGMEIDNDNSNKKGDKNQRFQIGNGFLDVETEFARRLREANEKKSYDSFFVYLHSLPVPTLDSELRSLTTLESLSFFLKALAVRMKERKDFEAVQVLLNVFLRLHGDVLVENGKRSIKLREVADEMDLDEDEEDEDQGEDQEGKALAESLREVIVEQHLQSERLIEMLDYCLGTLAFTRNLPLT